MGIESGVKFYKRDDLEFKADAHLGYVYHLAKRFSKKMNNYNLLYDLIQEGCFGLMFAYARYNPGLNFKFSTYAKRWIVSKMLEYVRKDNLIPLNRYAFYNKSHQVKVLSADINLNSKDDTVNNYCSLEIERASSSNSCVVKDTFFRVIQTTLANKIKNILRPKEQKVIEYKYYKDLPLSDIGKLMGNISKQGVFCFEKNAIRKLRDDKEIQNLYPIYLELLYS